MELVFLLFCLGAGASLKSAWDHASADRGKGGDAKVKAAKKAAGGTLPDARARPGLGPGLNKLARGVKPVLPDRTPWCRP